MDLNEAFSPLGDEPRAGAGSAGRRDDRWRPIFPVPDGTEPPTAAIIRRLAPDGYSFTAGWRYLDAQGRLLGCVVRYDRPVNGKPAEKQFRPFLFCEGPGGHREWRSKGFSGPSPLYGLPQLTARPDAPVLIVEGEKTADCAARRFPDHVVITSPGGSSSARKADWRALADRVVTIWRDADGPGTRYADDVADMARRAGASAVKVVRLPEGLPTGWDLADDLPAGITDADLENALRSAEPASAEGPIPLFPPLPSAEPFPIGHLGPVLSRAAAAIARKVQVPDAIAAQSVLAVAGLVAQAHADIMLPYGQQRPLSLFFVTVAASGDRKSTADNEALWPIRWREKGLKEQHEAEYQTWAIAHAAWMAEKKKIESDRKMDFDERKRALFVLGTEPSRPLHPFLTAPEPTIEGLTKAWIDAPAALGIFTAEGGMFIGGHGMAHENRLRSAASYSAIWDGDPIKRIRSLDGVSVLHGRRLSLHLMVQPEAAAQFLADPLLRGQGFLSRMLVAAPDSIAGSRTYRDTAPEDEAAIRAYGARILSILEAPWPLAAGSRNELDLCALTIAPAAVAEWREFYNHVEQQCGRGQELHGVQDFAAKVAEHAARIAGVLTIIGNVTATEVGPDAMNSAIVLADWYLGETTRLQRAARTDPRLLQAQQLLDWLKTRGDSVFSFREIIQLGPSSLRVKAAADDALKVLASHGWIEEVSARPRKFRLQNEV